MLSSSEIRKHFPLLTEQNPPIYFDNAATTLTPLPVIKKIEEVYTEYPVNIHRGAYALGSRASQEFEKSRLKVQSFLKARSLKEIIFTKGATESINLLCYGMLLREGDEVIVTEMEHHSNFAPWKMRCDQVKARLKVVPLYEDGTLNIEELSRLLTSQTKLVCVTYVSNTLGHINPISTIRAMTKKVGAELFVDAAQAVAHFPIDVQELDVDYLCFSGHKMFGPFGVGVLYGKEDKLTALSPYQWGGGMVDEVSVFKVTERELPYRFEAGTPAISSVIALGAAIDFIYGIGFQTIRWMEEKLRAYLDLQLNRLPYIRQFGSAAIIPIRIFVMESLHPHDLTTFLDEWGIAIRAGHHCTQPIMSHFGLLACNRISLAIYNTYEEIDALIEAFKQIKKMV